MIRSLSALLLGVLAGCGPDLPGAPREDAVDGGDSIVPSENDEDGDTISDSDEGAPEVDTDQDGEPDYLDADSDNDGVPDDVEAGDDDLDTAPRDSDTDGIDDFRDTDSDDNGRPDGVDGMGDTDGDGILDFAESDDDGDLLSDVVELGPTPESPVDTDGDGIPDFRDTDSDGDTIDDFDEGGLDPDLDGIDNYRDADSDGDCRLDGLEAGDADLATPPVDSDGDSLPDFLDLDSDNDGLGDGQEDIDCDGVQEPGESSPLDEDTDGDGVTDLVEVAAGTDPTDPSSNPQASGDFVFLVPYEADPSPSADSLDFATDIAKADVFYVVDTTGSMGGEISNLKTSLASITETLAADIPSIAIGIGGYDDFPTGSCGSGADEPWYLLHRVMTTSTPEGLSSVQAKVNALTTHSGSDVPESGWQALYHIATGAAFSGGGTTVAAFDPAADYPSTPVTGEELGDKGGVGFRAGALPIVVWITDAYSHNSDLYPAYDYDSGGCADIPGAARSSDAIAGLLAIGARVIGVLSGTSAPTKADTKMAVEATGAVVPPSAWGTGVDRPTGCAETQCCTGTSGVGEATDGAGLCPLVFSIGSNGTGLGSAVTQAIEVLTNYAVIDIGSALADDPADTVDAVGAFVERVEADPSAGAPCASGLTASDTDSDGILDTFSDVSPGTTVCFRVVPKINLTVPATDSPQMFRATLSVMGDGVTVLDSRDVYFLVPPVISEVPLD